MKRRKKILKKRKILDKKIIFSAGLIAVIALGLAYYKVFLQTTEIKFSLRAAIIDQLGFGKTINLEFNETATSLLNRTGFSVSYHKSENITVDFYKGLASPESNYGIIILRNHSALRNDTTTNPPTILVDLFTSEKYTDERANELWKERQLRLVTKGYYNETPDQPYFAITHKLIESLEGYFPKSIVIAMGCWSLRPTSEQLADAFIKKGAKAYIGWNDTIYQPDTDTETIHLLEMLLIENMTLVDAISNTRNYICHDGTKTVTTRLDFYPKTAYNLTISELAKEAKPSTTLQSAFNSFESLLPLFCAANVIDHRSEDFTIYTQENKRKNQSENEE